MIRVLVADDQPVVRTGFHTILGGQPDITVVGEAADGAEAVELGLDLRPDVVLMDIRMPVMDGIEATRHLAGPAVVEPVRVLILTTFDLDEYVYGALLAGASGFLLKDSPREELTRAVRVIAAGNALFAPSVSRRLIEEFAARPIRNDETAGPPAALTPRETEVLRLVATGMSNAEISKRLHIGEATVKTHVSHLLMKLDLRDRVHAVIYAYEHRLIRPGDG